MAFKIGSDLIRDSENNFIFGNLKKLFMSTIDALVCGDSKRGIINEFTRHYNRYIVKDHTGLKIEIMRHCKELDGEYTIDNCLFTPASQCISLPPAPVSREGMLLYAVEFCKYFHQKAILLKFSDMDQALAIRPTDCFGYTLREKVENAVKFLNKVCPTAKSI